MQKKLLIILLIVTACIFCLSSTLFAQKKAKKIEFGYGISYAYNLYTYSITPNRRDSISSSSGQVLNVLPGLHMNLWFGNVDTWILSLEAGATYLPFALDIDNFRGMGILKFPLQADAKKYRTKRPHS